MGYVIDGFTRMSQERSLYIEKGKIRYTGSHLDRLSKVRLNYSGFTIAEGKVTLCDSSHFKSSQAMSEIQIKEYLKKGCTTLIVPVPVFYERQVDDRLTQQRKRLAQTPLDYLIAVRMPLKKITERLIRRLKKEGITLLCLRAKSVQEMQEIPWQRIAEAMFPKRMMIVIEPTVSYNDKKARKDIYQAWDHVAKVYRLNTFFPLPNVLSPLPGILLKRLGLYPQKGRLQIGSDADYLMFHDSEKTRLTPDVIVCSGKIIKAGNKWHLYSRKGKELSNLIPEKFLSIRDVYTYSD
ncbi:hypothetical protein [Alteribacter populi]|uniref:hypothetical protein n=1 Tax=Alteribacter populi TaxID=2011011 RepID=UPI000BBB20D7|nr:hypothetical protein [Alteribacter populi]